MRSIVSGCVAAVMLAFALFPVRVAGQTPPPIAGSAPMSQEEAMATCEAAATAAKINGDARKSFISTCVSRKAVGRGTNDPAKEKLTWCDNEATQRKLVDAARRTFMSDCVRGFVL
jgi:hypothetical protein